VSLVSRHLEANGISTVVIGSARDIVEECGVARFVFSDFPLGNPCGKPYDVARLAGHNALGFDCPRLGAMFKRHGAFLPAAMYQPLDTLQLSLWHCARTGTTPANYQLGTLCQHFAIPLGAEGHDALADVRATIALAQKIMESA